MKKLTVYDVYAEDATDVYKLTIPAVSKNTALEYAGTYGMDVVAIKKSILQDIDLECLTDTLKRAQWGQPEIDIITRTLIIAGLDRL